MDRPPSLPRPLRELPESIQKFCDPDTALPMRTMASRGLVPVKGADLLFMLAQIAAESSHDLASNARTALAKLPDAILTGAVEAVTHPGLLDALGEMLPVESPAIEYIVAHPFIAAASVEMIAKRATERVSERIAVNEQRLLRHPMIIEALYKNPSTRMSTADRMIDLAARNNVELPGIPAFKDHAAALEGQLIPEPTEEPLPTDQAFVEAVVLDDDDPLAVEPDKVDGTEKLKKKNLPLAMQVKDMTIAEKIRLTMVGGAAARSLLVRDRSKVVATAAISSPKMTDAEAAVIAQSKEVSEDILRYIGNRRQWHSNYQVKKSLVFNPKTPLGIALTFLGHMNITDLKDLTRSRGIPAPLKSAAGQRIQKKEKSGG